MSLTPEQLAAVRQQVARGAVDSERALGGVPPAELTAAQCILESGWLQFMPPNSNNPFGIKWMPPYPKVLAATHEWFDDAELKAFVAHADGRTASMVSGKPPRSDGRRYYAVRDYFRAFPSLADAFDKHGLLLRDGSRYKAAGEQYKADKDLAGYVRRIAQHYSTTAPDDYAASLMRLIVEIEADVTAARTA
jgi:flagellum-specific peptidoglycan hydrolase FlgJ